MKKDLRARLEAIAAGRDAGAEHSSDPRIDATVVEKHQADFSAWHVFAGRHEGGEALPAPSAILAPLP